MNHKTLATRTNYNSHEVGIVIGDESFPLNSVCSANFRITKSVNKDGLEIWFGVCSKDHPPHDRVGKSKFSWGQHVKNHKICHNNSFSFIEQPRRTHSKDCTGMIVGVTLNSAEGYLQFTENG